VRVIEKEQHIPLWIPASLVALIALLSFLAGWNPANRYFPLPGELERSPFQYEATTAYKLNKISTALDHYFLERKQLPLGLETLLRGSLLKQDDIVDAYGREFRYDPQNNKNRFKLAGREADGRPSKKLKIEKQF